MQSQSHGHRLHVARDNLVTELNVQSQSHGHRLRVA